MHQRDMEKLTDEELMALYQRGNDLAFNCLFKRYSGQVYGYLAKHLGNKEAANDVFQSSFLKLHRSKEQFNSSFTFTPWLFTVVRTVLLDWQKDHRNKVVHLEMSENIEGNLLSTPKLALDSPDLSKLPENQRQAIQMRYFEDLSFEEIAKRLETSPSNIRQMISRGVKLMRSLSRKAEG